LKLHKKTLCIICPHIKEEGARDQKKDITCTTPEENLRQGAPRLGSFWQRPFLLTLWCACMRLKICMFCFRRSRGDLRLCSYSKLSGVAVGLQVTFGVVRWQYILRINYQSG
jgi:hypothetical protein